MIERGSAFDLNDFHAEQAKKAGGIRSGPGRCKFGQSQPL